MLFPEFFQFIVSNKQLRASKTYISCQKRLLNQEVNNKQKAVKILQEKVIEVKNSLNCKMNCVDYANVCNMFLVSNKEKETKLKKHKTRNYAIYFFEIWVKILTHVKILIKLYLIFQVITCMIMKNQSYVKTQILLSHQMLLTIQNFYYLFKCNLEKLPVWILVILMKNVSKVDFEIALTHHLSRFPKYLTKIFPERRLKH